MPTSLSIIQVALQTIQLESSAIAELQQYLDTSFESCIQLIHQSKGRLIISGIGKSAIIAQKLVATFNSTGTPSLFMHAADAIHGDLGLVQKDDIVMLISKSGESAEIKVLIPFVKNFGNNLIALCGNEHSTLAKQADYFINTTVQKEACPNNLAPTTSTTAQLVMGDAMAICLLQLKAFTATDFAKFHPGGTLGKQLYLKVNDLSNLHSKPQVDINSSIKQVIIEITSKRLGATAVLENEQIVGIITDGDIRRMLEKHQDITSIKAKDIMNPTAKTIDSSELAVNALSLMRQYNISQLVVKHQNKYEGIIHLHDLVREGIL